MNFTLPETQGQKGFTCLFAVDNQYAGFFIRKKKSHLTITLGWITLKVFKASEAKFNNLITVATLAEAKGVDELVVNGKAIRTRE